VDFSFYGLWKSFPRAFCTYVEFFTGSIQSFPRFQLFIQEVLKVLKTAEKRKRIEEK